MDPKALNGSNRLQEMLADGTLVIVPVGFRCHTKMSLAENLKIRQNSQPFDSGFFPPEAICSLLESGKVDLAAPSFETGHAVCMKQENFEDPVHGKGIRFFSSSYEEIDRLTQDPEARDIGRYLDSTFGYFTLDKTHNYVLAHFNWHRFASQEKSGGVYDVASNIRAAGDLLTRRIKRMMNQCRAARSVLLVIGETQGFTHMTIDGRHFDLRNTEMISHIARKKFGAKSQVINLADIPTPERLLEFVP